MSIHRIKLAEVPINNSSFTHQTSLHHHLDNKHKKKTSVYKKQSRTPIYKRLKTDQKQASIIVKHQHLHSYGASIPVNHSASKLHRTKPVTLVHDKKHKKGKQTVSVINLTRSIDDSSKLKNSTTITKRKVSTTQFNQKIKSKMQDYKILSNCLQEYVKEQRRNHGQVNLSQIIKIIAAFNRSEIGPMNKNLQKFIHQIIESISFSMPQPQLKSILKKSSITFDSPSKEISSLQIKNIDTVKKRIINKQQQTKDVIKLQQNLDKLKYQSNRLKTFLEQISSRPKDKVVFDNKELKQKIQVQKLEELKKLKEIANEQARIIRELQYSDQDQDTFRQSCS